MKTMINQAEKTQNKKENFVINYYNKESLCSAIYVDVTNKTVKVENFTDDNIERAFGINQNPTWTDFELFLESRCFPKDRQNLKYELKKLGLNEYDPLEICKATGGRNYKDEQWMTFSDKERESEKDDYESDVEY